MGRGKAADAAAVRGACAWACMRRDPGYRAAWAAQAGPVRFEAAPFPLRVQTAADIVAADWGLAVWEDPDVEAWRTPFLPGMPALVAEPDPDPWPDPAPLLGLLGEAGARLEGLRLLNGRFVLKAELGDAALQILVPSGRAFGPGDGIVAKLGLSCRWRPRSAGSRICGGSPAARPLPQTGGGPGTGRSRAGIGGGRDSGGEVAPLDGRAHLGHGQGCLGVEFRKLDARAGPSLDPESQGACGRRWRDLVPRHVPEIWRDARAAEPDA